MSTQNQRSNGPRRSRGGRRRPQDRQDRQDRPSGSYRPSGGNGNYSAPAAPVKLTFWQRVLAFFKGKKSPAPSKPSVAGPAKERPQYQPRSTTTATVAAPPKPTRKPEAIEVTTPKLYVGNLSFDAAESDLSDLFNGVGAVKNAEIVTHKVTEKSKGFGFVTMSTIDEAKRAVETLHDKEFMGRKLVVSGAKTNDRVA